MRDKKQKQKEKSQKLFKKFVEKRSRQLDASHHAFNTDSNPQCIQ